jgi:predicted O-methyltransferase YrrM
MTRLSKLTTIGKNSVRRRNFGVMFEKLTLRLFERDDPVKARAWCQSHAEDYKAFLKQIDANLYNETENVCDLITQNAQVKIDKLGLDLGGGGHIPLLYFFTRHLKAKTVVETGVAAGWSSQTILTAIHKNNNDGHLYSSDFPYFRYENPEQYVGFVVIPSLKEQWTLHIDGDRNNIPKIDKAVETIDLLHYDSDKSSKGRKYVWNTLSPKLSSNALVIYDDIQDNMHFRDLMESIGHPFKVFEYGGKYIGVFGAFLDHLDDA